MTLHSCFKNNLLAKKIEPLGLLIFGHLSLWLLSRQTQSYSTSPSFFVIKRNCFPQIIIWSWAFLVCLFSFSLLHFYHIGDPQFPVLSPYYISLQFFPLKYLIHTQPFNLNIDGVDSKFHPQSTLSSEFQIGISNRLLNFSSWVFASIMLYVQTKWIKNITHSISPSCSPFLVQSPLNPSIYTCRNKGIIDHLQFKGECCCLLLICICWFHPLVSISAVATLFWGPASLLWVIDMIFHCLHCICSSVLINLSSILHPKCLFKTDMILKTFQWLLIALTLKTKILNLPVKSVPLPSPHFIIQHAFPDSLQTGCRGFL